VGLGRFAAHRRGRLTRTSEASTHSGRVRHRTLTDQLNTLTNQRLADAMENEQGLLLLALDRYEAHGWPLHRLADRLGVGPIVLATLDFSALARRRLKRGSFHSVVHLQAAINRYIAEHNDDPKPFTWTKTPRHILARLNPLNAQVH
jgi:hypothetical protein